MYADAPGTRMPIDQTVDISKLYSFKRKTISMEEDKDVYLCVDCKHCFVTLNDAMIYMFDWNNKHRFSCRKAYVAPKIDNVVIGSTSKGHYQSCGASRIGKSREGNCGEDAYYWAPKDKKNLFRMIKKAEQDASKSN